jgi:hypothetical protein
MELELEEGEWTKWFVVQKSTIAGAGYGLFAARDFDEKETVGIYLVSSHVQRPDSFFDQQKPNQCCKRKN